MRGALLTLLAAVFLSGLLGCSQRQDGGSIDAAELPGEIVQQRAATQLAARQALKRNEPTQILFGDLHVHTTFSPDAFITAMPLSGGNGLAPPAVACDFARYCSAVDFWSINDHAEGITPQRWRDTKDVILQCNAVAGDPDNPDVVAFLGWEWSQVSTESSTHFGHKNVVLLDTADELVPKRAIAAPRDKLNKAPMPRVAQWLMALRDFGNREFYLGIDRYYQEIAETPLCAVDVDTRELPENCLEVAPTPRELFSKLEQWGVDSLVIPHGNAWGMKTPPGTRFDKQLNLSYHDPKRQTLFEVF